MIASYAYRLVSKHFRLSMRLENMFSLIWFPKNSDCPVFIPPALFFDFLRYCVVIANPCVIFFSSQKNK